MRRPLTAGLCPTQQAMKAAIKAGADVNQKDDKGYTPLAVALQTTSMPYWHPHTNDTATALKILLDAGADPNVPLQQEMSQNGASPLHWV